MTDSVLLAETDRGVLHLTLNRPAKRNALSAELRQTLVTELDRAAQDSAIGAVLLSGAGDHFCAGFDLDEIAAAEDPVAVFAEANDYHRVVHTFPKPLIAAITGYAVAGGIDLALMCDLRVAAPEARLGQPQVRNGIPAAYDLLAAVVGDACARDLCLTGRVVDGAEALRIGLVHRITDEADPIESALALAVDIAALPAAAATKEDILRAQADLFG